jgi:hypothetical protein
LELGLAQNRISIRSDPYRLLKKAHGSPAAETLQNQLATSRHRIAHLLSLQRAAPFRTHSFAPPPFSKQMGTISHDVAQAWPMTTAPLQRTSTITPNSAVHLPRELENSQIPMRPKSKPEELIAVLQSRPSALISSRIPPKPTGLRHNPPTNPRLTMRSPSVHHPSRVVPVAKFGHQPLARSSTGPQGNGRTQVSQQATSLTLSRPDWPSVQASSKAPIKRHQVGSTDKISKRDRGQTSVETLWQPDQNESERVFRRSAITAAQSGDQNDGQAVAATLHLDGATLGRWAIQHMERALARPSNGMTGVDPRATMPRGHISPF